MKKTIPLTICIAGLLSFMVFIPFSLQAQSLGLSAPEISWQKEDSFVQFQSQLRPLRQIAGAPEAFYTYFWEFGDGDFSFNEKPKHAYPDSGSYAIRLYATNNYDDGKAPPTHPRKIKVNSSGNLASNYNHSGFFKKGHHLQLKVNRMPKPNEDMVCIIGYKNPAGNEKPLNGSLVLFYNDKKFKKKNFGLTDLRKYHQETSSSITQLLANRKAQKEIPIYALNEVATHGPHDVSSVRTVRTNTAANLLSQKQAFFENEDAMHFKNLKSGNSRYVFAVLHTTPEMIKDTNATVTLSAMMIPDDPNAPILETNLELQIVASHDPNRMMLSNNYLNYRFMGRHKKQKYKVRFQNTGKGPAHTIDIGIKIPPIVNASTLTIQDMYPKCVPCATAYAGQSCIDTLISKDSIHFIFKNVHLPGLRQKNVEDKDSTKGFVKYRLHLKEKPPKLPFYSQAGIIFDSNPPVYTNKMHTRFFPGISPAIIAGYQTGFNPSAGQQSPFVLGAALTTYAPYRTYFQVEAYASFHGSSTYSQMHSLDEDEPKITTLPIEYPNTPPETNSDGTAPEGQAPERPATTKREYRIAKEGFQIQKKLVSLSLVPIEIRNNLTDWLSIGGGLWLKANLYEKLTKTPKKYLTILQEFDDDPYRPPSDTTLFLTKDIKNSKKQFSHINPGAFFDINIGKVRVGPSVGFRFYHFFNPNKNGLMIYAIWRL